MYKNRRITDTLQKMLVLLLTFCMMAGALLNNTVHAEEIEADGAVDKAVIKLDSTKTGKVFQEEEFVASVSLSPETKFTGIQFEIYYDTSKIELVKAEKAASIGQIINSRPDLKAVYYNASSAEEINLVEEGAVNGKLLNMTFKAKTDAVGSPAFEIKVIKLYTNNPTNPNKFDAIAHDIDTTGVKDIMVAAAPADIKALSESISTAKGHLSDLLTQNSLEALKAAITEAEGVMNSETATQAQVDDQKEKLDEFLKTGLEKAVDKTELKAALDKASAYTDEKLQGYTVGSVENFKTAKAAAQHLMDNLNLSDVSENQTQVATAAAELDRIREALIPIPDKKGLEASIAEANEILNGKTPYMDEQKPALQTALAEAQKVSANAEASEKMVTDAKKALDLAIDNMVVAGVKDVLDTVIAAYTTDYPETAYTTASYIPMKKAITAAQVLANKMSTEQVPQTEVDKVTKLMEDAVGSGLVKRAEDKTGLETAIKEAQKLTSNREMYTSRSYESFEKALDAAVKANSDIDAIQSQVDSAKKALSEAQGKLEERAKDKTKLNTAIEGGKALKAENYTEASYSEFMKVVNEAEVVYKDIDATQAQVDTFVVTLEKAKNMILVTYAKDKKTGVEVVGLPNPGTEIKVEDKSKDSDKVNTVQNAIKDNVELQKAEKSDVLKILSIKPNMTAEELAAFNADPNSFVTLYIPLDKEDQGYDNYKICHVKEDGSFEWITPEIIDGKTLKIKVSSFSDFAVIGVENKKADPAPGTETEKKPGAAGTTGITGGTINPNTGVPYTEAEMQSGAIQAIALLAVIGLAGTVIYRKQRGYEK